MKTTFTPGPWYVGTMNDALFVINEPPRPAPIDFINDKLKTKVIATPTEAHEYGWSHDEVAANARLIAAAPTLYEACREIVSIVDEFGKSASPERLRDIAKAALHRATQP